MVSTPGGWEGYRRGPGVAVPLGEPFTTYCVSCLWRHKVDREKFAHAVCAFQVSGNNPLTVEEAKDRGRAAILARQCGGMDMADWDHVSSCASVSVMTFAGGQCG
jgi:hypothetical protein